MQLVIVAGGKGTRLRDRLSGLPKPMVDVCGKPLLCHQLVLAARHSIRDIVLLLGHGADVISDYVGDGSRWGLKIRIIEEAVPLGTAGAVLSALPHLADRFVVMYGDTMVNVDLQRFLKAHVTHRADAALFLHPNDHPQDSDLVEVSVDGRITAFHPYPHLSGTYLPNLVNAALYVVEKNSLASFSLPAGVWDFGKHLFPEMLRRGHFLFGYRSPEYIKDAGTPERLDNVIEDVRSGKVDRGSFATPAPAVFLDRDGTMNREVNRVKSVNELEVLPGVPQAICGLNRAGIRAVVITNQPVIARGDCTEAELSRIHNKLETVLGEQGAYVDAIYHCPHHPDSGYPGERRELKVECDCRKPGTRLIQQACEDMNIDMAQSWFVGDSTVDIRSGRNAGLRTILVETGHAGADNLFADVPDYRCAELQEAVEYILRQRKDGVAAS
jgi:histidinol-phosphate phosphatase family protein